MKAQTQTIIYTILADDKELSPNLGDGRAGQAAAVVG